MLLSSPRPTLPPPTPPLPPKRRRSFNMFTVLMVAARSRISEISQERALAAALKIQCAARRAQAVARAAGRRRNLAAEAVQRCARCWRARAALRQTAAGRRARAAVTVQCSVRRVLARAQYRALVAKRAAKRSREAAMVRRRREREAATAIQSVARLRAAAAIAAARRALRCARAEAARAAALAAEERAKARKTTGSRAKAALRKFARRHSIKNQFVKAAAEGVTSRKRSKKESVMYRLIALEKQLAAEGESTHSKVSALLDGLGAIRIRVDALEAAQEADDAPAAGPDGDAHEMAIVELRGLIADLARKLAAAESEVRSAVALLSHVPSRDIACRVPSRRPTASPLTFPPPPSSCAGPSRRSVRRSTTSDSTSLRWTA